MPLLLRLIFWLSEKLNIKLLKNQRKFYEDYYNKLDNKNR